MHLSLASFSSVGRVVVVRLLGGLFTLWVVSIVVFAAVAALPGDYAQSVLGQAATPETVAAFRSQLGLDEPLIERYFSWTGEIATGDLGMSYSGRGGVGRPVADLVLPRLSNTLLLAAAAALVAIPLSLVLGVLAARYHGGWFDRTVNATTLAAISFPEFFVGYILILFLSVKLPIFHSLATINEHMSWTQIALRLALPVLTLCLATIAHMMRTTRNAIVNLLDQPFIAMAELKGILPTRVLLRHALPNALAPIASVIAFNIAYLIVGVVVVEVVFVYPGIGQAMVDAVRTRDVPVVQACALIFALAYILVNLAADIVAIVSNPRLVHPK